MVSSFGVATVTAHLVPLFVLQIPQKKGLVHHAPVAELDVFVDEEFMR